MALCPFILSFLLISHVVAEEVQTKCLLQSSSSSIATNSQQRYACKAWCSNKVENGQTCSGETCTWDIICNWDNCAACNECPTTTTTSTEYTPYCKGITSLVQTPPRRQKTLRSTKRDWAKKVERENQALLMHHSYCGKREGEERIVRNVSWTQSTAHKKASTRQGTTGKQFTAHKTASTRQGSTGKGDCEQYTSTLSPDGVEKCDGDKSMPYAYAYHLHPTYDSDSRDAAQALYEAFAENFGVSACSHVDEQTIYSTQERLCFLSTVRNDCWKDTPTSWDDVTAIFGLCQFGIYVRAGAMFDDSLGADGTSPWQWFSLNKDCAGADIDVLTHAVMCPALAHGQWAMFVNGTRETDAGHWITGDNSNDGCYGRECNADECESSVEVSDGTAVYQSGCCATTAIASHPLSLDDLMAKTYSNFLKFQTDGAWWDVDTETMKDYGTYTAEFPATVWTDGVCHGVCDELE